MRISSYIKLLAISLLASGCISATNPSVAETREPQSTPSTSQTAVAAPVPEPQAVASVTPDAPKGPRIIGPGMLVGPSGEQIDDGGKLQYRVLGTSEGTVTFAVWSSLHPKFAAHIDATPELYANSTIKVLNENFVSIVPPEPFAESKLGTGATTAKPVPGLAYANPKGEVLISLSEAAPPEGFLVIGQASLDLNAVDVWKTLKEGRKVESAGGLRT